MQNTDNNAPSSPDSRRSAAAPDPSDDPGGPWRPAIHATTGELPIRLDIEDALRALRPDVLRWLTDAAERAIHAAISLPAESGAAGADAPFEFTTMTPHPHPHPAPSCARAAAAAHEVRVAIVDDRRMAELHQRHSGVAGTTDVLTFDMRDDPGIPGAPLDVDIVVCIDEARRQSEARGHGVERELLLYILHGALHCLGHDDRDEASSCAMHDREDLILVAVGVGVTYEPAPVEADPPEVRTAPARIRELKG